MWFGAVRQATVWFVPTRRPAHERLSAGAAASSKAESRRSGLSSVAAARRAGRGDRLIAHTGPDAPAAESERCTIIKREFCSVLAVQNLS